MKVTKSYLSAHLLPVELNKGKIAEWKKLLDPHGP